MDGYFFNFFQNKGGGVLGGVGEGVGGLGVERTLGGGFGGGGGTLRFRFFGSLLAVLLSMYFCSINA